MRLSALFVVALSACGARGIKPLPDIDWCAGIKDGDTRYAYCVSVYESSNREYRRTPNQVIDQGYIMISPKHYAELQKYMEYLEVQAKRRCK